MKANLLEFDAAGMAGFCAAIGEKPFRARQVLRWVHRAGESEFERMSDLSRGARERLAETAEVMPPRMIRDSTAADGTRKWLLDVGAANAVETVFIPEEGRGTLEITNQARVRVGRDTIIGEQADSFGEAIVTGRNSLLWTFEHMIVGRAAGNSTGVVNIKLAKRINA